MTDFYSYSFNKPELLAPAVPRPHHRLQHAWALWTQKKVKTKNAKSSWYDGTTCVGRFDTIEGFWQVYSHLLKPEQLTGSVDVMLFKDGVKPFWEDDQNRQGGRVTVRIRKTGASVLWEEILMLLLGEQFDPQTEICGTVLSVRYHDNHISIWNRSAENEAAIANIKEVLAKTLNLPSWITLDYTRHKNPDKGEKGGAQSSAAAGTAEANSTQPAGGAAEHGGYAGHGSAAAMSVPAAAAQYSASGGGVGPGPGPAGAPASSAFSAAAGAGPAGSGWRGTQGHTAYAGGARYGDRGEKGGRGTGSSGGGVGGGGPGTGPMPLLHAGTVGEMDAVPLTLRRSYTGGSGRDSSHLHAAPTPSSTPVAYGDPLSSIGGVVPGDAVGIDGRPAWNKPAAPWSGAQQGGDGGEHVGSMGGDWSRPPGAGVGQPPLPMGGAPSYDQGHHRGAPPHQQQQHYRPGGGGGGWGARGREQGGPTQPHTHPGHHGGGQESAAEGWQTVPVKR